MSAPLILITVADHDDPSDAAPIHLINARYADGVRRAGGIPILISASANDEQRATAFAARRTGPYRRPGSRWPSWNAARSRCSASERLSWGQGSWSDERCHASTAGPARSLGEAPMLGFLVGQAGSSFVARPHPGDSNRLALWFTLGYATICLAAPSHGDSARLRSAARLRGPDSHAGARASPRLAPG